MKPMPLITSLLLGLFSLAPVHGQDEPDKIGTVNMQQLLAEYYKMAETIELFKGYKEEVIEQNKEKMKAIETLVDQTRELQAEAEKSELSREKREELFGKLVSQQREAEALQNARMAWLERKNAAFREKEAIELGKLREEIVEIVREEGENRGFDFIFDRSGASGANVLILAYAKDATDLTAAMIERINQDAPEKAEGEKDSGDQSSDGE